ncbi:MAG: phosphopentomutase [Syntrophomonadaceae bacterium]|nr:phosphopentomutase [Syntrophomonadaceae bacterium]
MALARRVIIIVLDSVGIGALPDADIFGDEGCNTLVHTARAVGGLRLPNLQSLGLGNIASIEGVSEIAHPQGAYGKMAERSGGKDTTSGHWEMMGLVQQQAFPTYPNGFPAEVIEEFENKIGRKTLGNTVASGTVIIEELGREHMDTGYPIVYTSADSVFQIAAHEEVIPLDELYGMCIIAREMLTGKHRVGRVIARPFIGQPGSFTRTAHRHDYSLEPGNNIMDCIIEAGQQVIAIGKIADIFAGHGVSVSYPTASNREGMERLEKALATAGPGLIYANLVDFDQSFGHRNDPDGYARALEEFDQGLSRIIERLRPEDCLMITADHGCDPTMPGTDHTREYVPFLAYGPQLKAGVDLGTRTSFADIGATLADYLGIDPHGLPGESFLKLIKETN